MQLTETNRVANVPQPEWRLPDAGHQQIFAQRNEFLGVDILRFKIVGRDDDICVTDHDGSVLSDGSSTLESAALVLRIDQK